MMHGVSNHLWQSTAFAVAVGLLALVFRRNRAAIRHALWLSATAKFLVPFSLLFMLGHHLWREAPAAPVLVESMSRAMIVATEPFPSTPLAADPLSRQTDWVTRTVIAVWFCGLLGLAVLRLRAWLRLREVIRSGVRVDMGAPIEVRSSAALLEPGVVGWLHPILLVPCGIKDHLTTAQIDVVIAHELCHVRRRDNLAAAVQIVVETIFWFHPIVWWIGARLLSEREKACDEEVLRLGAEPGLYAGAILKVCRLYVESPLTCVAGLAGSNLRKRIEAILENRIGSRVGTWGKVALAAAGSVAMFGPLVIGMMNSPLSFADHSTPAFEQGQGSHLAFEVASVKPDKSDAPAHSNFPLNAGDMYTVNGGLFSATNLPLVTYIAFAYDLMGNQMHLVEPQLPHWAMTDGFDIQARAPEANPTKEQMRLMMRSLLADRFKFVFHTEKRQMPVLALVLAKPETLGPQLQPHPADAPCQMDIDPLHPIRDGILQKFGSNGFPPICQGILAFGKNATAPWQLAGRNVRIGFMADMFSQRVGLGRPIIDGTGLKGTFDFLIEYAPEPQSATATVEQDGPGFEEALRDQLGLKMQSQKASMDVMVVDHIERPSPN
jgi:bla regulator protein blaR1